MRTGHLKGGPLDLRTPLSLPRIGPRRSIRVLMVLWSVMVLGVLAVTYRLSVREEQEVSLNRAKDSYRKDLVYRRWAAERGGVYVPLDSRTPPNPHLAQRPDRDVTTTGGKRLTLVNPAYMTRMVYELGIRDYGLQGHITSAHPIRPENGPDPWERKALAAFEGGAREFHEVVETPGGPVLRYMGAFLVEESCLACHRQQGYRVGDVRGGISVSVPMGTGPVRMGLTHRAMASVAILGFWVLGMLGLIIWARRLRQVAREQEGMLQALAESSRRFQAIQATTPDGMMLVDADTRITWVNDTYCRLSGYTPLDLVGQPISKVEALERPEETQDHVRSIARSEGPQTFRTQHRAKDGRLIYLEVTASRLDAEGSLVSFMRDITEELAHQETRRKLEAEVQHAQKLESLGSLAGGIAHDMNNVLAAILGMATVLKEQHAAQPQLVKALDTVERAASRGRDLVKGLTDFARKDLQEVQEVDLNGLVRNELDLLIRTSRNRFEFTSSLAEGLPAILGDPSSLGSAFMNLCVNAFDAMPRGGTLHVATLASGSRVKLVVQDSGEGIPPEVLHRVTEPFFTTKPAGRGTGLGLAMVYGTVKAHGGSLDIQSEVGKGTRITLSFPAAGASTPQEASGPQVALPDHPLGILIVDDDEQLAGILRDMVTTLGHQGWTASSALEALRRLEGGLQVDLVILDHHMPGLSGAEALPRFFQVRPDLSVLLSTGFLDNDLKLLLAHFPAVRVLHKPYSLAELRRVLGSIPPLPG